MPSGLSGPGLDEPAARGSTVWSAKLDSDKSLRRGGRMKGPGRGPTGRVILQESSVIPPLARAVNRGFVSKSLEIDDLCSSLRGIVPSSWAEGGLIIMSS